MTDFLRAFKKRHKGFMKRAQSLISGGEWHLDGLRKLKEKEDGFSHENTAASNVLERLSAFIAGADGERHLKDIQEYINYMVTIIYIHLDRVEVYYGDNIPEDKYTQKNKVREEQSFQQDIFKASNKIVEKMNSLNIENSADNLQIKLYNNKKASLLLREPLIKRNVDIRAAVDNLNIDWSPATSPEMLINMNPKDVPPWNQKKHFWEQDNSTIQFWQEERRKTQVGVNINGYHVHPWLYWHLNIFKTPIPLEDGTEPNINPFFRDNEYFFIENVKDAEAQKDKGIMLWGTRRWTKSVIMASYVDFKAHTKENSVATVTAGNDIDLADLTDKIKSSINERHPAFKLDVLSSNWDSGDTKLGIRESNTVTIDYSIIRVKNLVSGTRGATQKTAGGGPSAFVNEEVGKYSFLKAYLAALPSFETPYGYKCLPILSGTAGEEDMSDDAFKVLSNPEKYNILTMNWDLLEKGVDPEHITWNRNKFATFLPGQMCYKFKKKESNLAEYLNQPKAEDLKKISIQLTDWGKAKKELKEFKEEAKGDRQLLQQRTVQYPVKTEDSMMSAKNNPFPVKEAKKHRDRLIAMGTQDYGMALPIRLKRKDNNMVDYDIDSNPEFPIYPHSGGHIDSPGLLFGEFPAYPPERYRFIAGFDDYRHEQSDGESVSGFYIFDRLTQKIVYSLATRPDPHKFLWQEIHTALDAWNAICCPENEDMKIVEYFNRMGPSTADFYLAGGFDPNGKFNAFTTSRKYGWQPNKNTTPFVKNLVVDYAKHVMEEKNEEGNVVSSIKGVERIDDIYLLDEIIAYKLDGNFDRIIGFGSVLLFDYYLTAKGIFPKKPMERRKEDNNIQKERPTRNRFFTGKRYKLL